MRHYWLIILLILNMSLKAQPAFSDSLRQALHNDPVDSNHVKKILTAILYLPYSQPDSALYYAKYALKISQQLKYDRGIGYSYAIIAECSMLKGDYSKAIFYIYQHLNIFTILGDIPAINRAYYQQAEIHTELGEYRKALEYKLKVKENLASIGFNLKTDWYTTGKPQMWFHDYNLAIAFLNVQMFDSALKYGESAILANNRWSAIPILMGDIFLMKKNYTEALKYFNIPTIQNYPIDSVKNFIGKANAFKQIRQQDSCRLVALEALLISRRINYTKGIMLASELLSFYYEDQDPNESLKYLKISNSAKDSLYNKARINQVNSIAFNDELRRLDAVATNKAAVNRIKIWSLFGALFTLLITGFLLWRNNQHRKKANVILQQEKQTVEKTLEKLRSTQNQLIQSEKMASLGELTAGIAHEIQNPLNFVNNFSEVNKELLTEMKKEIQKQNYSEVNALANDIVENEEKISHHGKRAETIVKGMLQHSRSSSGVKEPTDINKLAGEYLRLAYHGLRAKDKTFDSVLRTSYDESIDMVNIIPHDIGRVILNVINNALYAVNEKKKQQSDGYEPTVWVGTKKRDTTVVISIEDNGNGIPRKVIDKIFHPFFTTKPAGQGTGLGLSLAYEIIKAHGGEIKVEMKEVEGAVFTIYLPMSSS